MTGPAAPARVGEPSRLCQPPRRTWSTCRFRHRHLEDRPSVSVVVFNADCLLLVPDDAGRWAPPVAPLPLAHRPAAIAASAGAAVLGVASSDLQVLPAFREEPCELHGLRIHFAAVEISTEQPQLVDDSEQLPPYRWASAAPGVAPTLDHVDELTRRLVDQALTRRGRG